MLVMVMMMKKNYDIDDADNRNTDFRNNIDRVENEHTNLTRKKTCTKRKPSKEEGDHDIKQLKITDQEGEKERE